MREVFHTRTADGEYNLFVGSTSKDRLVLGKVNRTEEKVPGGRDDSNKTRTVYMFTPADGIELKGMKSGTMKGLKEDVGRELPDPAPVAEVEPLAAVEA